MTGISFCLLLITSSFAGERPQWTFKTPQEASGKVYFVGRSILVESEAEGVSIAGKDAKEQLLRKEFGTLLKLDSTQKETLDSIRFESTLKELSERVILKGWTQEEVFSLEKEKGVEVYALFSVPRMSINSERERIERKQPEKQSAFDIETGKIYRGMTKDDVLKNFGEPSQTNDIYKSVAFHYANKNFCEQDYGAKLCSVFFDKVTGRVSSFSKFLPDFIEKNPPSEEEIKKRLAPKIKIKIGIPKQEVFEIIGKPSASYSGVNMPKASFWGGKGEVLKFEGDMCNSESMYDSTYEMGNFTYSDRECGIGIYEGRIKYIKNFDVNFLEN